MTEKGTKPYSFDAMTDFQNMYQAYKKTAAGKRNKQEVIDFELELAHNLWDIIKQMKDKTYRVGGYHRFMIYDPKEREIQALSFRDRVVQHCLCDNILKPYFEKRLIYDNAACREGKGTHFAMDRLSRFMREHYKKHGTKGYILKYDIRHYFDSIDHEVLKGMLSDFPDRNVLGLLYHIIRSYEKTKDTDTGCSKGLPMGNQTSQWFALYYLDPMDRLIKEKMKIKHYVRYMDDGILIHESKEYLNYVLCEMKKIADELKLSFNEKTQIFPISHGVDFLGFRFYLTDTGKVIRRLRTSNKRRWKRRLKKFKKDYQNGEKTIEEIGRSIVSYRGHLSHGHTYKLNKKVMSGFVLTKATDNEDCNGEF
ncbi:MAG: group II intron reverse transcriptase domain-containing protein [Lachnospiraceae bacterium]|nr:group II intron reverse transcriptase domain-containing protein [Lachnospiraceae bacterium]MBQ9234188.1 group II intron reverse transcriptase domain-containing protein [Lachnospiraceae bacterium]